ncbi:hypothetical protein VIS19158_10984 [Vibrio scophthalmi LMG 19158]|uniref:Uncharacterized protein n=1 Tax=Vibrio scophthalmi LMG 19158 TaxID=870967 RepID=F9RQP5_9VIBR|nr:hypothetical protein VIS19158_10984 [Vibrio scophthalmi LMG 19158]
MFQNGDSKVIWWLLYGDAVVICGDSMVTNGDLLVIYW